MNREQGNLPSHLLNEIYDSIKVSFKVLFTPLSIHHLAKNNGFAKILLAGIVAAYALEYSANLLQRNFDLYYHGEIGAFQSKIDSIKKFEKLNQIFIDLSFVLIPILLAAIAVLAQTPSNLLLNKSLRSFKNNTFLKLTMLLNYLGQYLYAAVSISLAWNLDTLPEQWLKENLVSDGYMLFSQIISFLAVFPIAIYNIRKTYMGTSLMRAITAWMLYLTINVAIMVTSLLIAFKLFRPLLESFFHILFDSPSL